MTRKLFYLLSILHLCSCDAQSFPTQHPLSFYLDKEINSLKYRLESSKHGQVNDSISFEQYYSIQKVSNKDYNISNKREFWLYDSLTLQKESHCILRGGKQLEDCSEKDFLYKLFFTFPQDSVFEGYEWELASPFKFSNLEEKDYSHSAIGKIAKVEVKQSGAIYLWVEYVLKVERDFTIKEISSTKIKDERVVEFKGVFVIKEAYRAWKEVDISYQTIMKEPMKNSGKKQVKFLLLK